MQNLHCRWIPLLHLTPNLTSLTHDHWTTRSNLPRLRHIPQLSYQSYVRFTQQLSFASPHNWSMFHRPRATQLYLTQQLSYVSHSNLNKSHLESLCKLRLKFQRITAQQTQVHLRLSWGSVHGSNWSNIELGGLTWALLSVLIICMHRGARTKVSLRWQDLRLNTVHRMTNNSASGESWEAGFGLENFGGFFYSINFLVYYMASGTSFTTILFCR